MANFGVALKKRATGTALTSFRNNAQRFRAVS
jgi:hypothetical protein